MLEIKLSYLILSYLILKRQYLYSIFASAFLHNLHVTNNFQTQYNDNEMAMRIVYF